MPETNAIRPEIKGLFETVKQQAHQYQEAFDRLEYVYSHYQQLVSDLENLSEKFQTRINNEIFNLKQKYDNITKILTIETNKTIEKYSELQDLKTLQDSYQAALNSISLMNSKLDTSIKNLEKNEENFEREITIFKNKTNEEIQNFINDATVKIQDISNKVYENKEIEIKNIQRAFDLRLIKLENSMWAINDKLNYEIETINKELSIFRDISNKLHIKLDKLQNQQFDKIKEDISKLELEIANINSQLYTLENKTKSSKNLLQKDLPDDTKMITAYFGRDYEDEFNKLISQVKKIENELINSENKNKILLTISITSISLAAISIILSFVL